MEKHGMEASTNRIFDSQATIVPVEGVDPITQLNKESKRNDALHQKIKKQRVTVMMVYGLSLKNKKIKKSKF